MRGVNATPSPHEVDQLLGLRLMLEDALRRAQHAGPHQRATATVLLDATVERATFLTCVSLGLQVKPNEGLDALISRVKQELGGRWQPRVLPDVRLLHRARNVAQHEGLAPDHSMLPGWASATEAYVVGLIDAGFEVDVRRVVMSDAIVDPELRALIATAETALAGGELEASARASMTAFRSARERWDEMHRAGQMDFWPPRMTRGTPAHTQSQIDELRSVISTAALAADPSEVAWFRAASREPDVLDSDDVERMLSFAFGWVATFDLAQQSWVPDRRRRAAVTERLVRSGAGPARISEVVSMGPEGEGRFQVVFRLCDVPGPDEYDDWAGALAGLLYAGDERLGDWNVRPNGTVTATFPESDATAAVQRLVGALAGTDAALAAAREEREAERSSFAERTREYRRELAGRSLPKWVNSVEIRGALFAGTAREGLSLVIDESMANLVAPPDPTNGAQNRARDRIHHLLRNHDFVEEVNTRGGFGNIEIRPIPTADQLAEMLGEADVAMQGWLVSQREHDAARTAFEDEVRAQITAAVDRASGDAS
jgi:hypothetical protein